MADIDNHTTLRSLLCHEAWHWDPYSSIRILFNEDGTGSLLLKYELHMWIAAPISWSAHDDDHLNQHVSIPNRGSSSAKDLASLNLSVTLHPERLESLFPGGAPISPSRHINADILHDAAFVPKDYAVRLQAGDFISARDERRVQKQQMPWAPKRFGYKLVFDKSPYPSREEWKKPTGAPDSFRFWEYIDFVSGEMKGKVDRE